MSDAQGTVNVRPARGNEFTAAARTLQGPPVRALYLHVPFCFHKCHYCDFYSIVEPTGAGEDRQRVFTDALVRELEHQAAAYSLDVRTIFVGGGTPTLLRPDLWRRLLRAIDRLGLLDRLEEFTVEANPETVGPDLLHTLAEGGVNRLSIGAQSFQPKLLEALERHHDPANVARAVRDARAAGIDNINLDLIFAIPGQRLETLDVDLDRALALEPTHLSYYNLTYEPNTAMTVKLRLGRITPVEEDLETRMYDRLLNRLEQAGFEHYEISNWARRGGDLEGPTPDAAYRCGHNLAYWKSENYLGVGPSASSHINGRRWKSQPHLGRYLRGSPSPPIIDDERLPPERRVGEKLMLMLRLREGVALTWLREHLPEDDPRWTTIEQLIVPGLLERTATRLRLTRRGLFVADAVIAKLL